MVNIRFGLFALSKCLKPRFPLEAAEDESLEIRVFYIFAAGFWVAIWSVSCCGASWFDQV